ncbi:MAG TPA: HEAT repeat domain-containing protein [Planctomycetota bacterium]|nr:HEAT repeat domain-containing protein [Planctomycetota bacterium]
MSVQRLPSRPDLRHLRLQAKTLLKKCREGDLRALKRLGKKSPDKELSLGLAQRAIARHYSFRSWRGLKAYVDCINAAYAHQGPPTAEILEIAPLLFLDWRHMALGDRLIKAAGPAGLRAIEKGLQHKRVKVRKACAQYLDHFADAESGIVLKAALRDPAPAVRAMAAHAIACERCKGVPLDPAVVDIAVEMLNDSDPSVRSSTVCTLGAQKKNPVVRAAIVKHLALETIPRPLWLARNALAEHARDMFALKGEEQIRQSLGTPACVIEAKGNLPRILIYDPRVFARPEEVPEPKIRTWVRFILDVNGRARSIAVVETPELRDRKTGWS